ncbi:hypothetical protein WN944_019023 [Citrus x changshan-huyou]|uniref:Uncharacterized protein n=1 Tax=Citrus x changshan-huyou TaxID=2935761 RepID=A0AAP0QER3_9ROSI
MDSYILGGLGDKQMWERLGNLCGVFKRLGQGLMQPNINEFISIPLRCLPKARYAFRSESKQLFFAEFAVYPPY